ncbi:MAG: class I SAM-dependent methyltransferase [Planctomycetes bacterium]|nr:class I SAM-dependent methyltransferase [Planctomycetota bacterium]
MADSYSSKLQIWEGWARPVLEGRYPVPVAPPPSLQFPPEYTDHLYASETLGPPSLHGPDEGGSEPYTLQWFLDIEHLRHHRYARWLPSCLEFNKHAGETLLGLGVGLGTDWVQYARYGASVVVCSPSAEHLALVRRNFDLRQFPARFLQTTPTALPLDSSSIDVVCVTNLLHKVRDPKAVVAEVYRVLKPGGKVLAVTPGRYDIDFWRRLLLPWRWGSERRWADEPATRYTGRRLRGLFHRFVEHRVHKRHLRRADVPHLWRLLPTSMLERLIGRLLIVKAFKPLSAAMPVPLAA